MINQIELKKIIHYSAETGHFTWLISPSKNVKRGDMAGCISNDTLYMKIRINKKQYSAHRLAFLYMTGKWPENQIDHINHIRNDNKWSNLREATSTENNRNQSISKSNKSGFTGVYWSKLERKWKAQIKINNKVIGLGTFIDKEKAILKRQIANILFGFHENHGAK